MANMFTATEDEIADLRAAFGPKVASVVFWDAEEGGFDLAVASDWDDAEIDRLKPGDELWEHVSQVIAGRGETVKFHITLPDDERPVVWLSARQLETLREALGDAVAFRNDSGEADEDYLEDYEKESLARYRQLAEDLSLSLD